MVEAGLPANVPCTAGIRGQARFHHVFGQLVASWAVNKKSRLSAGFSLRLVPRRGLEPPRLAALVPETSASTNSAIWAGTRIIANVSGSGKGSERRDLRSADHLRSRCFVGARVGMAADVGEGRCERVWATGRSTKKAGFSAGFSLATGAQKRTRTSTPRSAST